MTDTVYGAGMMRRGRLRLLRAEVLSAQLAMLRNGPVEITIRRRFATRSQAQNNFYWVALVQPIADHTGYPPSVVHQLLKAKFLPRTVAVHDRNGTIQGEYVLGGTTRTLTVGEFADYCRAIETWVTEELGFAIPSPERVCE